MRSPLGHIAVVIPSRNEEQLLPLCLESVAGATAFLASHRPLIKVSITVVLDRTTDTSARLVDCHPAARSVVCDAGSVGAARDLGIRTVLAEAAEAGQDEAAVWIANTDADSTVPRGWLLTQAGLADEEWDVVVGKVQPDPNDLSDSQRALWFATHTLADGHGHIHGANLGFRAGAYAALGGFRHQPVHEDRDFVHAARTAGLRVLATDACRVTTSGRTESRVRGGFADFLANRQVS
ncbi:glycosyltransferase [Paenarthrobacter sp. Z7-10]|uniref:glycosyltransferase n=1 Tax=Paenarthrobacter sp. Z7-10 TaxID=2787635 RepID=UPI0022A944A5|nr:glycosyltransferase [Paenarthrobacter sp. Z7-10]MCZ2404368.1 glycosyltransferase [Paenarthrobacter sp. Z7-10]